MKEVKIFNYPWHIAHQRELARLPDTKWSWLVQHRRQYSPFPRGDFFTELGMEWVPDYEKGKYDFALLHLDQQCFEDSLWERGKGSLYRDVNSVVQDIPKVVIMHGTPYYPESFASDVTEENYAELGLTKDSIGMSSELIKRFHKATEEATVIIFNSHTAKKQWDCREDFFKLPNGSVQKRVAIWHGMEESEWHDLPKEPRVVTMISPGGLDMYYDRTLLRAVKEILQEKNIQHCHITVDASFKNWEEYRDFLGRSLVYFNPTRESPMPRARTEAMLSGACVVSIGGQDVEMLIESGENGIIVPRNPQFIADVIEKLIYDYQPALEMGQKAKQTVINNLNYQKFADEWAKVIEYVTNKQ